MKKKELEASLDEMGFGVEDEVIVVLNAPVMVALIADGCATAGKVSRYLQGGRGAGGEVGLAITREADPCLVHKPAGDCGDIARAQGLTGLAHVVPRLAQRLAADTDVLAMIDVRRIADESNVLRA